MSKKKKKGQRDKWIPPVPVTKTADKTSPSAAPANTAPKTLGRTMHLSMVGNTLPDWYIILLALFVALPAIVAPYGHKYGYSPDLHMSAYLQVGVPAMLAVLFVLQSWGKGIVIPKDRYLFLLASLIVWSAISISWAHNLYEAVVKFLDWAAAVGGFLLIMLAVNKRHHLNWVVEFIFWSGVVLGSLGIAQWLFNVNWVDQYAAPSATFNNKNMAAQYGLLTWPLGVALFLRARTPIQEWVYGLTSGAILLFIIYTRTRAAWLSIALEFTLLLAFLIYSALVLKRNFLREGIKLPIVIVVSILVLFFAHLTSDGFHWFFLQVGEIAQTTAGQVKFDGTGIHRISIWANTLAMIWEHPFGVGVGNWVVEYPLYHTKVLIDHEMSEAVQHINTHNDYLEIGAELGWIGIVILIGLAISLGNNTLRLIKNVDTSNREILLGVSLAIVGISFDAIFSFPFQQPVPIFLLCVYIGIIAVFNARERDTAILSSVSAETFRRLFKLPPKSAEGMKRAILLTGSAICAVLSIWALTVHIRWFDSEVEFRKATINSQKNAAYEMLLAGKRSHELSPMRDRMLNFVAMGHMRRDELPEAVEAFEGVLNSYPHLIHTLNNTALAYSYAKQYRKAEKLLRKLVKMRPHSAKTKVNLGILLYQELQQPAEGVALFKDALEMEPGLPQREQLVLAIETYEKSMETGVNPASDTPTATSTPTSPN